MPGLRLSSSWSCASSIALFAQSKDDKKKDEAQKREIQSIVKSVDDLAAGQPAANDLSLTWVREDVLKAQGNKEYVPFTVQIDPSKVSGGTVAFYWRVVSKNAGGRRRRAGARQEGRQEGQRQGQGQEVRLRLRGHQLHPGDRGADVDEDLALVHRAGRQLRRVS